MLLIVYEFIIFLWTEHSLGAYLKIYKIWTIGISNLLRGWSTLPTSDWLRIQSTKDRKL